MHYWAVELVPGILGMLSASLAHAQPPSAPPPPTNADGTASPSATVASEPPERREPGTEAEQAPETLFAEVIVTAERRESSIQRTPVAVSAVSAADIRRSGIKTLLDSSGSIVGLHLFHSGGSHQQPMSIRGIGSAIGSGGLSPVGLYLDDVYLGRTFGRGQLALPDIERIEVLRGPQGTLYGQSTSAGAVKYVSRNPSVTEPYNWASVSVGNYGAREASVYLSTPVVTDRLSAALAYAHRQNDGDQYNATRKTRTNRLFVDQIRGKLRWTPNDQAEVVLTLDGTNDNSDNYIQPPNDVPGNAIPYAHPRLIYSAEAKQMHRVDTGQTLVATYDFSENFQIKSVSAHRHDQTIPHPWDGDGLAEQRYEWVLRIREEILTQEFQINGTFESLKFTAGANVYQSKFYQGRYHTQTGAYTQVDDTVLQRTYAAYAQLNYRPISRIGVTLGARYGGETQRFESASHRSDPDQNYLEEIYSVKDQRWSDKSFTPKVGVDVQLTDDLFAYASYTFGRKSGGFNTAATTRLVATTPFPAEKNRAAEVGLKTQFFERRLTFNVTAFHNKLTDYQAAVQNPVINGVPVIGSLIVSAGSATLYGAELETEIRPASNLQLKGNITLLRSRFDEFLNPTGAENSDFKGKEMTDAPKFSAYAGFSYYLPPLGIPGTFGINGSANYVGKTYSEVRNIDELASDPRTWVVGGVDYTSPDDHWTLSVLVKNVLDKDYRFATQRHASGTDTSRWLAPRTILATVRYEL